MMVRDAMQRAVAFFQHKVFPPQAPALLLAPVVLNGVAATAPSNPLLEAIWLAAPKSKVRPTAIAGELNCIGIGLLRVTPSRKKIRNNHLSKRLKNIVHFQDCPMCGDKKLRHRLCMSCFKKGKYFV
ncbi:hypothetical protein BBJ28_00003908 [Nothophytophthora sp. Chile5]|nr:hypothetical protein BBJ28_00003908 [Nothophytophthora sp. Chile5]